MIAAHCQRWSERRARRVGAGTTINPAAFDVDVLGERSAKAFVQAHHYSGTFPAARLSVGLFHGRELVGVAVFSEGMQPAALPKWAGVPAGQGCELGRLVLLDAVAGDGESWFMTRALRALRREKPGLEAVISYADPVARRGEGGEIVKPGHVGTVYQAMSALYRGRASRRTDYFTPGGAHVSRRALSKIMLGEIGEGYAVDQLHGLDAPRRYLFETGRDWIDRLRQDGFLRGERHPGNHTYVFPLTRRARATAKALATLPYPKVGTMNEGRNRP